MWRRQPLHSWTCLLAATFVAGGCLVVHADDPTSTQDGYKVTSVQVGGKTVRVKELDPYRSVQPAPPPDGKYHPTDMNFSAASPLADKKFSLPADGLSKSDPDFNNHAQNNTFITKPYESDPQAPTVPNLNTKASFPANSAYSRNATGFDKGYLTASADAGQNQTAVFNSSTSPDQGRTAVLGGQTTATYPAAFADKTFQGPEADAAHRHLTKMSNGQMLVSDLPNRPLTIDEVRDLINHGFKPDTDVKPGEQSKPLNDPNYQPQPLRDMPPPDTSSPASDDDKNDPVPPPGTMAAPPAPENSEPLPQP